MCGIVAVMRRASSRCPPVPGDLRTRVRQGEATLAQAAAGERSSSAHLDRAYEHLAAVDRLLRGVPGVCCLLGDPELMDDLDAVAGRLADLIAQFELSIDSGSRPLSEDEVEDVNASLLKLKDAVWAIKMDRVAHARAVSQLSGPSPSPAAVEGFSSI